ncbi:sigma-70 family RNA polymerase sigma factor [Engelhardtia mirabilis]|uniref:Sporulation sigma factor SigF n=1 Tax=Engelhardtia mirabilis TaxID=2528011 RepID=A0A518BS01_9BACT|nr:sporulation sigma factor SigF [Planctomycetes bacterium Pla133]QDV04075.1 sporulation sigma factor SigF [Planctomycetes bacterium Pla86]
MASQLTSEQVTQLLERVRGGGDEALGELLPALYDELRRMAAGQLRKERANHTLQPTALVHEAWFKLVDQRSRDWQNRAHFLAIAATAMRRILVHHAEAVGAKKRGGDRDRVTLVDAPAELAGSDSLDILALDEALTRLAERDPRKAQIVEQRFFAGLSNAEVAEAMGVTERTVERDWRMARAWLRKELERDGTAGE